MPDSQHTLTDEFDAGSHQHHRRCKQGCCSLSGGCLDAGTLHSATDKLLSLSWRLQKDSRERTKGF